MADRRKAPIEKGDLERMVLPSRAIYLSIRDTLCEARRLGLADAARSARKTLSGSAGADAKAMAVLETMWEAVSCLELAANAAIPWVDAQLPGPNGRWAEATLYDGSRVNRFFESSHNWSDVRFAALSAHRYYGSGDASMVELLKEAGFDDARFAKAFEAAEAATNRFLRERFQRLAQAWQFLKGYAASYEHGLLLVPSDYGEAVDAHEQPMAQPLIVWATRKDAAMWPEGHSAGELVDFAENIGGFAIDVADYVADARLRLVESLEFDEGEVYLGPLRNPISYWVTKGELSDETVALLDGMSIGWVNREEDRPTSG
jgi:hypothetical protein